VVKARIYMVCRFDLCQLILLTLLHRRTIFKMLILEQSAEKWPFSAGGQSSDRSDPPWLIAMGLSYTTVCPQFDNSSTIILSLWLMMPMPRRYYIHAQQLTNNRLHRWKQSQSYTATISHWLKQSTRLRTGQLWRLLATSGVTHS